jgi:dihydrofolate synthase / folylpolyglutamate synthase
MNFRESEAYLLSLGNEVSAMRLCLESIGKVLDKLGNPQTKYLKTQVAGTNGKGSVCAFLDAICRSAGIYTGLYTSPHLVSITERIKIGANDISEDDFARHATLVRETCERLVESGELEWVLTFFEQVTVIALIAFAESKVELAILETGLGGRLDATTAANAEIAAITRIDYDHEKILGDTIERIAAEKTAIIRADSLVCVGRQQPEAMAVIQGKCLDVGVTPKTLEHASFGPDSPGAWFKIAGFDAEEVMLSLPGEHQIENAALAILVAKQLATSSPISDENIYRGLENARHAGRLEWIGKGSTRILLDGAHNRAGAQALVRYLSKYEPDSRVAMVYGSMGDKDYRSILATLLPVVSDVVLTEPVNSRSASASEIGETDILNPQSDRVFVVPDVEQALDAALLLAETYPAREHPFVLVTGSLYLVGDVKKLLRTRDFAS